MSFFVLDLFVACYMAKHISYIIKKFYPKLRALDQLIRALPQQNNNHLFESSMSHIFLTHFGIGQGAIAHSQSHCYNLL